MDIATIIGLGLSISLVMFGILTSGVSIDYYWDLPSVFIVLGGSIGGTFTAVKSDIIGKLVPYFKLPFGELKVNDNDTIKQLVGFADKARREGLLALEDSINEIQDPFMKSGVQLVVDGTDPEIIKSILYNEVGQIESRHENTLLFFATWAALAPAFGMIGTLVGLIAMLANLQDSEGLAAGMATALITTLYGSALANIALIPFGKKLEAKNKQEMLSKEILIEGVLSIQSGDNPRTLQQKLIAFLSPAERTALKAELGGDS